MNVILLERIEKLGQIGDVVSVKPGFARNYLLPQKKAMRATNENLAHFENQRAQIEADNLSRRREAEAVAEKLEDFSIVVIRQAGESGQLYGSVNPRDIAQSVEDNGVTVDRRQVALERAIKTLGLHDVKLRLHPEVTVSIVVNVARSEEEAAAQIRAGRMVTEAEREAAEAAAEAEIEAVIVAETEEEETDEQSGEAEAEAADEDGDLGSDAETQPGDDTESPDQSADETDPEDAEDGVQKEN